MNLYYIIVLIILLLLAFPYITKSIPLLNSYFNNKLEKFDSNKKIILSIYTADWCPHCVEFKKNELNKLKNYYQNSKNVVIKNVDCTEDKEGKTKTMSGKNIDGYPTLVINIIDESNNMKEIMYEDDRVASNIINYVNKLL